MRVKTKLDEIAPGRMFVTPLTRRVGQVLTRIDRDTIRVRFREDEQDMSAQMVVEIAPESEE